MRTIDRITLIVLALGLWALVLSPRSIEAHHAHAAHDCDISGIVDGQIDLDGKFSVDASAFSVGCDHRFPVKTCEGAGCVGTYKYD
jgi:hypothetical protein